MTNHYYNHDLETLLGRRQLHRIRLWGLWASRQPTTFSTKFLIMVAPLGVWVTWKVTKKRQIHGRDAMELIWHGPYMVQIIIIIIIIITIIIIIYYIHMYMIVIDIWI